MKRVVAIGLSLYVCKVLSRKLAGTTIFDGVSADLRDKIELSCYISCSAILDVWGVPDLCFGAANHCRLGAGLKAEVALLKSPAAVESHECQAFGR